MQLSPFRLRGTGPRTQEWGSLRWTTHQLVPSSRVCRKFGLNPFLVLVCHDHIKCGSWNLANLVLPPLRQQMLQQQVHPVRWKCRERTGFCRIMHTPVLEEQLHKHSKLPYVPDGRWLTHRGKENGSTDICLRIGWRGCFLSAYGQDRTAKCLLT